MSDALVHAATTRARPGHRGRIGVIQPAPGVLLEYEWAAHMPADVLFPVGRVRMTGATPDDYRRVADASLDVAQDLATAGVDVVAYACTVGSLFAGPDAERRLVGRLATAAGKPAIGIADASMRALHRLGARAVAIMSPYDANINELVRRYVLQRGLDVVAVLPFPVGLAEISELGASEIAQCAVSTMARLPAADALWIPCTAVRTMACLDEIEKGTGRIAVSGSQALLWDALRTIGIEDRVACGSLFRH